MRIFSFARVSQCDFRAACSDHELGVSACASSSRWVSLDAHLHLQDRSQPRSRAMGAGVLGTTSWPPLPTMARVSHSATPPPTTSGICRQLYGLQGDLMNVRQSCAKDWDAFRRLPPGPTTLCWQTSFGRPGASRMPWWRIRWPFRPIPVRQTTTCRLA